jgi:recombination DNA repair RAD52 pathway protein
VESWKAIELANSIFGFNGWSSSIVDITPDFVRLMDYSFNGRNVESIYLFLRFGLK